MIFYHVASYVLTDKYHKWYQIYRAYKQFSAKCFNLVKLSSAQHELCSSFDIKTKRTVHKKLMTLWRIDSSSVQWKGTNRIITYPSEKKEQTGNILVNNANTINNKTKKNALNSPLLPVKGISGSCHDHNQTTLMLSFLEQNMLIHPSALVMYRKMETKHHTLCLI